MRSLKDRPACLFKWVKYSKFVICPVYHKFVRALMLPYSRRLGRLFVSILWYTSSRTCKGRRKQARFSFRLLTLFSKDYACYSSQVHQKNTCCPININWWRSEIQSGSSTKGWALKHYVLLPEKSVNKKVRKSLYRKITYIQILKNKINKG